LDRKGGLTIVNIEIANPVAREEWPGDSSMKFPKFALLSLSLTTQKTKLGPPTVRVKDTCAKHRLKLIKEVRAFSFDQS